MHEHRTPEGKTIYYMSRADLERLPGHKGHGDTYRARCPIHGGDSNSAFQINYQSGWGHCFKCGDEWSVRVTDHPDTKLPKDHPDYQAADHKRSSPPPTLASLAAARNTRKLQTPPPNAPESPQTGNTPKNAPVPMDDARRRLQGQIPAAMDALPGSPGAAYLESRGIDLDTARALRIGWMPNYPRWNSAGTKQRPEPSVVFPYTAPDGEIVGATGRTIRPDEKIRYYALPESRGYYPALFNGGAVSQVIETGHPLLIVEGPLDAAAAYAAGYPLTVGIGSTSYKRWDHFAGVQRAILLLDNDNSGIGARGRAYTALVEYVPDVKVLTPAALQTILEGAGDLGEYWQRYQRMPPILGGIIMGPHIPNRTKPDEKAAKPVPDSGDPAPVENDQAMDARATHGRAAIETPMQEQNPHAGIELTGDAVRAMFADLPIGLQVEALELIERLQHDRDFAKAFRADFYDAYAVLDTPDRVAVLWALIYHPADVLARWKAMLRAA